VLVDGPNYVSSAPVKSWDQMVQTSSSSLATFSGNSSAGRVHSYSTVLKHPAISSTGISLAPKTRHPAERHSPAMYPNTFCLGSSSSAVIRKDRSFFGSLLSLWHRTQLRRVRSVRRHLRSLAKVDHESVGSDEERREVVSPVKPSRLELAAFLVFIG
jgi:hypothetical protein